MPTRTHMFSHPDMTPLLLAVSCRWASDVNSYSDLDGQTTSGPVFTYEYNTRATYGGSIPNWTENDPLNATWWHHVTEGELSLDFPLL